MTASERIRRAIARRQGARHSGRHLDGLGRRLGRLLDLDRRRRHLRRAFDDHRLDRRVRHPAELPGHAAEARASAPTACARRRSPASRTCCAGPRREANQLLQMGVESTYRRFISLVAAGAAPAAGAGQRDRPGPGLGRRHRAPARPRRPVRRARRRDRRGGAARPSRSRRRAARCSSRSEPGWLGRLLADAAARRRGRATPARDAFARLARRPEAMIERAARTTPGSCSPGPAIQARCLECPAIAPVPRIGGGRGESLLGAAAVAGLAGVKVRRATADDAAAIASIYAPYVTGQHRLVRDRGARRGRDARGGSRRAATSIPGWSPATRTGRVARLCLCLRLPAAAGLSLHASRPRSMSPTAPTAAASAPCSTGRCCRCWRRRASPRRSRAITLPNEASVALHERLGFARDRHLREGRLQVPRMAQRRPLAAAAGAALDPPPRSRAAFAGLDLKRPVAAGPIEGRRRLQRACWISPSAQQAAAGADPPRCRHSRVHVRLGRRSRPASTLSSSLKIVHALVDVEMREALRRAGTVPMTSCAGRGDGRGNAG